jgi:hypothetical protein
VKSRLSSLIAAVSGKIGSNSSIKPPNSITDETTTNNSSSSPKRKSSDDLPPAIKTSPQLEKWHSALKIGNKLPAQLDSCHRAEQQQQHGVHTADEELEEEVEERAEDDGRLVAGRLLLGTKLLVEREVGSGRLYPAVISGQDGTRVAVTWKGEPAVTVPTHYEASELLKTGVLDLAALSSDRLRSGSRVAVFPYADAAHLIPGTVRYGFLYRYILLPLPM